MKTYIFFTHKDDDSVLIDRAEDNLITPKQSNTNHEKTELSNSQPRTHPKSNEKTIKGKVKTLYFNSIYIIF